MIYPVDEARCPGGRNRVVPDQQTADFPGLSVSVRANAVTCTKHLRINSLRQSESPSVLETDSVTAQLSGRWQSYRATRLRPEPSPALGTPRSSLRKSSASLEQRSGQPFREAWDRWVEKVPIVASHQQELSPACCVAQFYPWEEATCGDSCRDMGGLLRL